MYSPVLAADERAAVPALMRFRLELVLISAGFDAHERDPLGLRPRRRDVHRDPWVVAEVRNLERVTRGRRRHRKGTL